MANVLPLEERKKLYDAYRKRVAVLSLALLSVLILAAIVMLIPSLVIFSIKKEAISKQLAFLKESERVTVTGEAVVQIKETREHIKAISPDNIVTMSDRIKEVVVKRPSGVFIKSLIVSSPLTIELRGEATTREVILSYVRALEASKFIEKVDSPISNLINGENSQFVIKVTTKTEI